MTTPLAGLARRPRPPAHLRSRPGRGGGDPRPRGRAAAATEAAARCQGRRSASTSRSTRRARASRSRRAMAQLGGAAIPLAPDELQLSRGESLPDTARALSRYLDVLAVRTHAHAELEAWAEWASIPVINALTADEHPCQALADALTIRDRLGSLDGVRVAWVGDGSNVLVSLAALGLLLGYEVVAACPEGYEPAVDVPSSCAIRARPSRGADVDRHRHLDQHGPGARARRSGCATSSRTALDDALLAHASARRVRHALPAGAPRRGDRPRSVLYGAALGDLGRGGEPPARAEGAARAAPRRGLAASRARWNAANAGLRLPSTVSRPDCQPIRRGSSRTRNQSSIVTRGFAGRARPTASGSAPAWRA